MILTPKKRKCPKCATFNHKKTVNLRAEQNGFTITGVQIPCRNCNAKIDVNIEDKA